MSDEPFAEPDREAELARWREATAAETARPTVDPDHESTDPLSESRPVWIEQANAAGVEGWTVLDEAGNPVWIEAGPGRSRADGEAGTAPASAAGAGQHDR